MAKKVNIPLKFYLFRMERSADILRMETPLANLKKTVGWALLALSLAGSLSAVELHGSLSSELYTWTEDRAEHIRPYQRLSSNLTLSNDPERINLDWYTSLRWMTDLSDKFETDPQLHVYQTYLRLTRFHRRSEIRLGRQFVYNPVGSDFIDGLMIREFPLFGLNLDLYAGSTVDRLDPERVRSFGDFLNVGNQLSWQVSQPFRLMQTFSLVKEDGERERLFAGLAGQYTKDRLSGLARGIYDIDDSQMHSLSGRMRYRINRWSLSLEGGSYVPVVRANSIFAMIDVDRRQEVRFTANRELKDDWRVIGSVKQSFSDENGSTRLSLGVRSIKYHLAWINQSGDQSSSNGLQAGVNLEPLAGYRFWLSGGYNSYMVQDEIESDLTTWHMRTGLSKRLSRSLNGRAEIQFLSNPDSKHDVRALFSISKLFDVGGGE